MGSNLDPQRPDLFRIELELPAVIGGTGAWNNDVEFAIEKFPFPDIKQDTFPMKFLNQTNNILAGDQVLPPVDIPVRYAFARSTAARLYRWQYLSSNPRTGGVGLTSAVKCRGHFYWLIPDMGVQSQVEQTTGDVLKDGLKYALEGCLITGLKASDADMTSAANGPVLLTFTLHIDRYYPEDLNNMVFTNGSKPAGVA